jgi:hypothetical protein
MLWKCALGYFCCGGLKDVCGVELDGRALLGGRSPAAVAAAAAAAAQGIALVNGFWEAAATVYEALCLSLRAAAAEREHRK